MSKEAMKLALEALKQIDEAMPFPVAKLAQAALREALASEAIEQPAPVAKPHEQEPVAWLIWLHGPAGHFDHKQFAELEFDRRNKEYPDPDRKLLPLYTSPPAQRTWVGLTDEQIDRLWSQSLADTESETWLPLREFARAIEAAHGIKEKNQ